MIVRGDPIEPELARVVARLLGDGIRRDPSVETADLVLFLAELEVVAARRPTSDQSVDGDARPWLPTREATKVAHRSATSLKRDAREGRIEARKVAGRWEFQI